MSFATTGYEGIVVKFELWKSGSGSSYNKVTYTTDGFTWHSVGLKITDDALHTTTWLGTYSLNAKTFTPLL